MLDNGFGTFDIHAEGLGFDQLFACEILTHKCMEQDTELSRKSELIS